MTICYCKYYDTVSFLFLQILDLRCISPDEKLSYIQNLHCMDINMSANKSVSLTLKWTDQNNSLDPITHSNVYATSLLGESGGNEVMSWKGECVYLGTAYTNCFRVNGMHILSNDLKKQPFGIEFRLQAVTVSRRKCSVNDADSITVWFNQYL